MKTSTILIIPFLLLIISYKEAPSKNNINIFSLLNKYYKAQETNKQLYRVPKYTFIKEGNNFKTYSPWLNSRQYLDKKEFIFLVTIDIENGFIVIPDPGTGVFINEQKYLLLENQQNEIFFLLYGSGHSLMSDYFNSPDILLIYNFRNNSWVNYSSNLLPDINPMLFIEDNYFINHNKIINNILDKYLPYFIHYQIHLPEKRIEAIFKLPELLEFIENSEVNLEHIQLNKFSNDFKTAKDICRHIKRNKLSLIWNYQKGGFIIE
jgi:hypothetical protein